MEEKQHELVNVGYTYPNDGNVLVTVAGVDITYACEIDHEKGTIVLPENLPGGSEVKVNGETIIITPVSLDQQREYTKQQLEKASRLRLRPTELAVAIRAAIEKETGRHDHGNR